MSSSFIDILLGITIILVTSLLHNIHIRLIKLEKEQKDKQDKKLIRKGVKKWIL